MQNSVSPDHVEGAGRDLRGLDRGAYQVHAFAHAVDLSSPARPATAPEETSRPVTSAPILASSATFSESPHPTSSSVFPRRSPSSRNRNSLLKRARSRGLV